MHSEIEILSDPAPVNMADDWYQYATAEHFWMQWRFGKVRKCLTGLETGNRILEIGCGAGVMRNQLESFHGCAVDGCDLNLPALEMASSGQGKLFVYDVHQRRELWKDYFNTIYLLDVLEHIPDAVKFLNSVRYHLQKDGLLLLNVPAAQWLYSQYDESVGHLKRYSIRLLTEELAAGGFRLLKCHYWGFTMLPFLLLRKGVLRFTKREKIVSRGFQPPSKVADLMLRTLMHTENLILPRPPLGTSIVAVAQKCE